MTVDSEKYLHPRDEIMRTMERAGALVNSRLLGEVAPMSDEVIDDLKRAFAAMLS